MAHLALPIRKRWMHILGHKLGRRGLVRIVALHAIRRAKRLILVRLLQSFVLRIVAIDAQRRRRLGQMKIEFLFAALAGLVRHVARPTAHVQRRVPAALLRNVHADRVAAEAKIFLRPAFFRFQQLIFVIGLVRIMALQAVAPRRRVHHSLDVRRILIGMASETQ